MANAQLPIELINGASYQQLGVRIKRGDGLVYDPSDGKFKSEALITNPYVSLVKGTGSEVTLWTASISMDPAQWTDGDYRAYYHTIGGLPYTEIIDSTQLTIVAGTPKTPVPTDVAVRIINIAMGTHTTPGSLGGLLNRALTLLEYIADDVAARTSKPKPK